MAIWQVNTTRLSDDAGLIIGILNTSPESFYDGDQVATATASVARALQLYADGADIVEVGGQTTRPGFQAQGLELTPKLEIERTIPIITAIKQAQPQALVAIDTYKYEVMVAAVNAGVDVINDVNGFTDDPRKLAFLATTTVGLLTMWNPRQAHVPDVRSGLRDWAMANLNTLTAAGIVADRILLDPGLGYAKDSALAHDLAIMKHVDVLTELGRPILVAVSNKGWAKQLLGLDKQHRTTVSLVAAQAMMGRGARVLRVHDVKQTRDMLQVLAAIDHV
ncbi:dihydropteroate synthase [Weissella cibaria]|uniref:dihydropteroate synthase n=1 Tax=Weissella cibaria TaxID=137591 RepID=UPI00189A3A77|nr:dihydropteroate synthase [Weissella cibaria]MCT0000986.1 dihydropteroate synthase [Weissella cibaria]MDK9678714.1 dihydropteroate synthase [Weissella cibaria]